MLPSVRVVRDLVSAIEPIDGVEADDRAWTLAWLAGTDDIYRRVTPDIPSAHLVAYTALVDPRDGSSLLVDHIRAGLWLPPGGHVEPGEPPADTARREVHEELAVEADFAEHPPRPRFVTVRHVTGMDDHTDVSLWFVLVGDRDMPLHPDPREFRRVRWWTPAEVRAEDPARFDAAFGRFLAKIAVAF